MKAKTPAAGLDVLIVDVDEDLDIADLWNYTWSLDLTKDTTLTLPRTICVYDETNHEYAFEMTEFALGQFMGRCQNMRLHIPSIFDMIQLDAWVDASSAPLLLSWTRRPGTFSVCNQLPYVECAWVASDLHMISLRSIHGEWRCA